MENKNCEKTQLLTKKARQKNKLEDNQEKVLSDFKDHFLCDNSDTNKNCLLNKVIDFFEKKGYFFLFISWLKNEFSKKFFDALKEQCTVLEDEKFLSEVDIFLNRIVQCEKEGKEFLFPSQNSFTDVFFSYDYGNESELHGSLNINFTENTQCLNVNAVFEEGTARLAPNESKLKKLILYDNGHKSVVIKKNSDKENYLFTLDSSCQLIIKRFNENDTCTIILDTTSGEVINAELKINDKNYNPLKILESISSDERILKKDQNLSEILTSYFYNEKKLDVDCKHLQLECLPIKSLNDLKNWKPLPVKHITAPLRKRAKDENCIKTLVCHDMKGGYLEDSYLI